MLNAEGQYVLFVCEGVAEQYILTTLIERGELTVPNELIVPNQLRGTWYFTRKESKRMLDRFLNMSYGKHPLLIIRIVDSDSDVLRIPRGYEHAAEVVNLRTHPEIEMLVIINEGMYGKYTNGSKRLKPSDYCKRELGMKQVKSQRMAGTILGRVRLPRACVLRCSCRLPTRSTSRRGCVPCPSSMPSCTHP